MVALALCSPNLRGHVGPVTIDGPLLPQTTYDDEVSVMVQDRNDETVDSLYYPSIVVGGPSSGPQTLDTRLINGLNVWENGGKRFEWTVESGKSYPIRLVNTAIHSPSSSTLMAIA